MRRELAALRQEEATVSTLEQSDFGTSATDMSVAQSGINKPILSFPMPEGPISAPVYHIPPIQSSPVGQTSISTGFSPTIDGLKIDIRKIEDCFSLWATSITLVSVADHQIGSSNIIIRYCQYWGPSFPVKITSLTLHYYFGRLP